jgi:hypothetical protein
MLRIRGTAEAEAGDADLPSDVYLPDGQSQFITSVPHRRRISIEFHRNLLRAVTG